MNRTIGVEDIDVPETKIKKRCNHPEARFYALQNYGDGKVIRLYNCSACRSTISEQTLRDARQD